MKASKLLARATGLLETATPPPGSKATPHDTAVTSILAVIDENKPTLVDILDSDYDPDEQAICVQWQVSEYIGKDKMNVRARKWFTLPLYVNGVPAPSEAARLLKEFLGGWSSEARSLQKRLTAI